MAKGHFADLLMLNYPNSPERLIMYQQRDTKTEQFVSSQMSNDKNRLILLSDEYIRLTWTDNSLIKMKVRQASAMC